MHAHDTPAELARLREEVADLRARIDGPSVQVKRRARWRRRILAVTLIAALALPVAVSANHIFSDVPTASSFHPNISNLYGARITTGCSATTYCPQGNVTREQMAAFLNRGLGRMGYESALLPDDWAELDDFDFGSVTVRTGGATGGTGYLFVTADVGAFTDEAGVCPCELRVWLHNFSPNEFSQIWSAPILDVAGIDDYRVGTTSVSHAFEVASGIDVTIHLEGSVLWTGSTPNPMQDAEAYFSLSAIYVPFDAEGSPVGDE